MLVTSPMAVPKNTIMSNLLKKAFMFSVLLPCTATRMGGTASMLLVLASLPALSARPRSARFNSVTADGCAAASSPPAPLPDPVPEPEPEPAPAPTLAPRSWEAAVLTPALCATLWLSLPGTGAAPTGLMDTDTVLPLPAAAFRLSSAASASDSLRVVPDQ